MKRKFSLIFLLSALTVTLTACSVIINSNGKNAGKAVTRTLSKQSFTSIKTNLAISDLEIKNGDTYHVSYQGHQKIIPTVKVKNGVLIIEQKVSGNVNVSGQDKVTVVVPKSLKNVNLYASEGDITLNQLTTVTSQIKADEGDIDIASLNTQNKVNIAADEGDVNIATLKIKNGATIKADEGDINIKQVNASGYDLSSDEGDITVNGQDHSGDDSSRYRKNVDSRNVLKATADEGDITIK